MEAALIDLWDSGVRFSIRGEPFRIREIIPHGDIYGVNFAGSDVRDADLTSIRSLHNLTMISLSRTAISDRAFEHLCQFLDLEDLNLRGTRITDAAVPFLKELRSLQFLDVAETQVTSAGVTALKKSFPEAEIWS